MIVLFSVSFLDTVLVTLWRSLRENFANWLGSRLPPGMFIWNKWYAKTRGGYRYHWTSAEICVSLPFLTFRVISCWMKLRQPYLFNTTSKIFYDVGLGEEREGICINIAAHEESSFVSDRFPFVDMLLIILNYLYRGSQREYSSKTLKHSIAKRILVLISRYRHIFIPWKFFICSDFLAESLVIRKL